MSRLNTGPLGLLLCCALAGLPSAGWPASEAPTAQALLAEQDAETLQQMRSWVIFAFGMPADIVLDPGLRESAQALFQEQGDKAMALLPSWIAEERAAAKDPVLRGPRLLRALSMRFMNEMAILAVESVGPAHDEAWLKAALAPRACHLVYRAVLARDIAMIQAAPAEARPALLAAEKELLSRWGTVRQGLAPRPSPAELVEADHAITRLREGLPVTAAPMSPYLAGRVFSLNRKPGKPDRWEQCARGQWWLQTQLADGKTDRTQALTVYRYATLPDIDDNVPASLKTAPPQDKMAYPRAAAYFHVEGVNTLLVDIDENGKVSKAEVQKRELRVPGVRGNRPVAFETLLDDVSVEVALQRGFPDAKPGRRQREIAWQLEKGK